MQKELALDRISDDELVRRLGELVSCSRRVEADLVAHIGEVEARRLHAREASPSMFSYCTRRLHLSEAEAYLRITVARAARRHEPLLEMLRDGRLHLRAIALLAPLLTRENREAILARATHRSKREVEELVAELQPRPDVPARVRRLPVRSASVAAITPRQGEVDRADADPSRTNLAGGSDRMSCEHRDEAAQRVAPTVSSGELCPGRVQRFDWKRAPSVAPLSPARYRVEFTASAELHDKLRRLQALMRSEVPDGDLAALVEKAVSEKLARLEARRFGLTRAPRKALVETSTRPVSRHVPAAVRRAVVERDGMRCHYVDTQGRQCPERYRLEFHHRHPFGVGATTAQTM